MTATPKGVGDLKSRGLTKIEVVCVVVCIGVLLGLLLPVIQEGRDGVSRGSQCSTNLKNLSLAAIQYADKFGVMPGYAMNFGTHRPSEEMATALELPTDALVEHRKIGTWAVALLPWLDAQPTFEHWTNDMFPVVVRDGQVRFHQDAGPNLPIMRCPSDPGVLEEDLGQNSYAANVGMSFQNAQGQSPYTIKRLDGTDHSIDFATSMRIANGVFHNQVETRLADGKPAWAGPAVRFSDFKDGSGNTVLFSENLQSGPWHRVGLSDPTGLLISQGPWIFPAETPFVQGLVWHWEDEDDESPAPDVNPLHRINGGDALTTTMTARNASSLARPSSAHAEGVYAATADGGTRFLTESLDYRVYQALLTPNGAKSNVPDPGYVLEADAL
ncbi:MAG: DUF1559 domain-containing protein [Planctomycetota bacterium]